MKTNLKPGNPDPERINLAEYIYSDKYTPLLSFFQITSAMEKQGRSVLPMNPFEDLLYFFNKIVNNNLLYVWYT